MLSISGIRRSSIHSIGKRSLKTPVTAEKVGNPRTLTPSPPDKKTITINAESLHPHTPTHGERSVACDSGATIQDQCPKWAQVLPKRLVDDFVIGPLI